MDWETGYYEFISLWIRKLEAIFAMWCAVYVLIFCSAVRIIVWGGSEELHQAANSQTPPPALSHTRTRTRTCTHTHAHAHAHTHARTHTHTHTRARTHAHTHTHTAALCKAECRWTLPPHHTHTFTHILWHLTVAAHRTSCVQINKSVE